MFGGIEGLLSSIRWRRALANIYAAKYVRESWFVFTLYAQTGKESALCESEIGSQAERAVNSYEGLYMSVRNVRCRMIEIGYLRQVVSQKHNVREG